MTCSVCHYEWCWLCGSTISDLHFSPLNPFGCAGLQDQHHGSWGKCKIFFLRILIFIGILIAIPIILPITMVFCGPVILVNYFWRERRINRRGCFIKLFFLIILFPIGLILDPFIWIAAICWAVPHFFMFMCEYFERRR